MMSKGSKEKESNDTGLPIELDAKDNLPREDEGVKTVTKEPIMNSQKQNSSSTVDPREPRNSPAG